VLILSKRIRAGYENWKAITQPGLNEFGLNIKKMDGRNPQDVQELILRMEQQLFKRGGKIFLCAVIWRQIFTYARAVVSANLKGIIDVQILLWETFGG